jgi:HEAT repeat protein
VFTRLEIIDALAIWGTADSIPALIRLLDGQAWEPERAMLALAKLRDPRGARAIAKMLFTRDARKALSALREMGPAAEDAVLPLLLNNDPRMRGEVCLLLEEIGTAKSLPELKKRFSDDVKEVRLAAKQAYATVDSRIKTPPATAKKPE